MIEIEDIESVVSLLQCFSVSPLCGKRMRRSTGNVGRSGWCWSSTTNWRNIHCLPREDGGNDRFLKAEYDVLANLVTHTENTLSSTFNFCLSRF